jgi:hypothetical protein
MIRSVANSIQVFFTTGIYPTFVCLLDVEIKQ